MVSWLPIIILVVCKALLCFIIVGLSIQRTVGTHVQTYPADAEILITDVGESGTGALMCKTDRTDCCRAEAKAGESRQGNWIYPNGTKVGNVNTNDSIYRTRHTSVVILNRRNGATGPTGQYCCEVASLAHPNDRICINLSKMHGFIDLYVLNLSTTREGW